MSSLAATQSDGFYFPPEWRPEFGGLSKYQGSKGANQYQTHGIIRFELPFDAWCLKCGRHMSKGLRFNAKKEKAPEKYFTTQIWSFSMKCPCPSCDQSFVIRTDPENDTYNMVEGMRKMEQDFEPDENDSIIKATTDEERNLLGSDPMFRLQHDKEDKRRASAAKEHLESLINLQDVQKERDYDMNSLLRSSSREKRKRVALLLEEGMARGLNIPLVEEADNDSIMARSIEYRGNSAFLLREKVKMTALQSQSIFPSAIASNSKLSGYSECITPNINNLNLSSEARKQQRFHVAIGKQSVVNINVTNLKICVPPSSLLTTDTHAKVKKFRRSKIGTLDQRGLHLDDTNTAVSVTSNCTHSSKALNMLSMYSDNDDYS